MIELTSAGKIIIQKLAIETGILVPAVIDCQCHNTDRIVYKGGRYVCKRCGQPVEIVISGSSKRSIFSSKHPVAVDELQPVIEGLIQRERVKYSSIIDGLTKENNDLQKRCDTLEKKVSDDTEMFDTSLDQMKTQYETMIKDITESNKHLQKVSNGLGVEVEQWKSTYKDLVQKYRILKEENESLEHTKDHYRIQAENLGSISLSKVINYVLDYVTTLFNAAKDKENPESLRDIIYGRTEYLGMMLESAGINITHHERDSVLGNDRVDVEVKTTDNPELDCKVIKSEHFGCTFKSDIYPMIPEKVMVYRYIEPNPKEEIVSEEPAVEGGDANPETESEVQDETGKVEIQIEKAEETVETVLDKPEEMKPPDETVSEGDKIQTSENEVVSEV